MKALATSKSKLGAGGLEAQAPVAGARQADPVLGAEAELAPGAARIEREPVAKVGPVEGDDFPPASAGRPWDESTQTEVPE